MGLTSGILHQAAVALLMSELVSTMIPYRVPQVAWKNHLHMLHPSPAAYAAYMGDVAM